MSTMERTAWRGIALLEEKHGPNWADVIDLDELDLSSARSCVLGQLYASHEYDREGQAREWGPVLTDDVVLRWAESDRGSSCLFTLPDETQADFIERAREYLITSDGYVRGLALIDGPLLAEKGAQKHGFESSGLYLEDLNGMNRAQLAELGVTRDMVDAAVADCGSGGHYVGANVAGGYDELDIAWTEVIEERRQS